MGTFLCAIPAWLRAAAVLLFAALFFFGLQVPAAHAAGELDLTVNVNTKAGTALAGVNVYAYPVANHAASGEGTQATAVAGKTGRYAFSGLDFGQEYAIYFDSPASNTTAFDQFYGGSTWIEEAQYESWAQDSTLNVSLATNSTITGTVKSPTNTVIGGVMVYPWRYDGSKWYKLWQAGVTTNASGNYTLRNLEPGSYKVEFAPDNRLGYLPEFSGNVTTVGSASSVYLGLGATVNQSAGLAIGGKISGTVALADGSTAYSPFGVTAWAYRVTNVATKAIDTSVAYLSKVTTSNGAWTVAGLPTGSYVVKLYDTYSGSFIDRWSVNGDTIAQATIYSVVAGQTKTASKTTLKYFLDPSEPDTSIHIDIDYDGVPVDDTTTRVYIESLDGEDFYLELYDDPDSDTDLPLYLGEFDLAYAPAGSYRVWVDPGDPAIQPSITTQTVSAADGTDTWDIDLDDASAFTFTTQPQIAQSATVIGTTYQVSQAVSSLEPGSDVEYSYQWLRGSTPIFGATGTSYTTKGVDVGETISVLVRADTFGFESLFSQVTAADPVTGGAAPTPSTMPTISAPASPVSGSVLTADVGSWNVAGVKFTYEWRTVGGGTLGFDRTYLVKPTDAETSIYVVVTARAPGYATGSATSTNTVSVGLLPAPKQTVSSAITASTTGLPAGSVKYTISNGTWSPAVSTFQRVWYVNGSVVQSGAQTYLVCNATLCPPNASVEVELISDKLGYTDAIRRYTVRKATIAVVPTTVTQGDVRDTTAGSGALGASDLAQYGHVLTATPSAYSYPGPSGSLVRAYQWQVSSNGTTWANITGATKSTYTVPLSYVNKYLRVKVTTTSGFYGKYDEYFVAGKGALRTDLATTSMSIQIAGSQGVGAKHVASITGSWPVTGVAVSYQWYKCDPDIADCTTTGAALSSNWAPIAGATASTFVPTAALDGYRILVQATGSRTGFVPLKFYSSWITVGPATTPYFLSQPTLTGLTAGQAAVGKALTVKTGTVDVTGATLHWQWYACATIPCTTGWVELAGTHTTGTSATFTPSPALLAQYPDGQIRFQESATVTYTADPGYAQASAGYPLTEGTFTSVIAPTVSANTTTKTYTVNPGTWTGSPAPTFSYKWWVGDTEQVGQTSKAFTITNPTGPVYVDVTVHRDGYNDVVRRLVALKAAPSSTTPTLVGSIYGSTPKYGDTLSLSAPAFTFSMASPSATYKYQWYYNGMSIAGATGSTFTPHSGYVGKSIKVLVTVSSPYYATTSKWSAAVTLGAHPAPTGTPTIVSSTGAFKPGAKLTVATTGFPSGSTFSYSWQRSTDGVTWTYITAASSYVLTTSDPGKFFRVVVTGKKTGWVTSASTPTPSIQALYLGPLATTAPTTLTSASASNAVGVPLTVASSWNTASVTLSYKWYRDGVLLPGVTGTSWTPLASSFGNEIRVEVTASKAGYLPVVVGSNVVQVGIAPAPVASTKPVIAGMTGGTSTARAPKVGDVLTASTGVWNVDGLTFTYRWQINGVDVVSGGTQASFTVPDTTGVITVVVSTAKTGWAGGSSTSAATRSIVP